MSAVVTDTRRTPGVTVQPVPIEAVRIGGGFWRGWLDRLYDVTLPSQHAQCEATGRLDNIRRVAGRVDAPFRGRYYDESDVYKWLEAASWALAGREDRRLRALVDALVDDVAAAQQPDGYLHTYFALERADQRYTDLINKHELYCAGHLIQAGIAHHRATGATTLLDVAVRLADHICAEFGPDARETADGHPEIELALVELARETGRRVYAEQARFFLEQRGRKPPRLGGYRYLQDHEPAAEQQEIAGHAVRAVYLACGLADAGLELDDPALWEAAERLWRSAYETKVYVTGGLGAHWAGESFGDAFDLPNRNSYAESCAAVAGVMWNWRLLAGSGEARYADWMETTLYNGMLAGLSLDGEHYFYPNPLSASAGHARVAWFDCACCPPNLARLLASLPGFLYGASERALWVHQFVAGRVDADVPGAGRLSLEVDTDYPWSGEIQLTVRQAPDGPVELRLRVPGWCDDASVETVLADSGPAPSPLEGEGWGEGAPRHDPDRPAGDYAALRRVWSPGDRVMLRLPMPPRRLVSDPRVTANIGRVALARGPLIYCVESHDRPGLEQDAFALPDDASVTPGPANERLPGMTLLDTAAVPLPGTPGRGALYQSVSGDRQADGAPKDRVPIRAIPYFAWANRGPSTMDVWLRRQETLVD
ncbi:MAG: glycoside hydrolase family 127 protein [Chloroflexi bacterium]|nr:glycoside hydrolase family 127 protein [Chloroflexota bacterium]